MVVDLSQFVAGGYFLSRYVGPDWTNTPMRRVTVASDHSPRRFFPDSWTLSWCDMAEAARQEQAAEFGIAPADLGAVMQWADRAFNVEFGAWHALFTLPVARRVARTWLGGVADVELWGIGLHQSHVAAYCRASAPPPPKPGYAPMGASATHEMVCLHPAPLAADGEALGFELLVAECGGWNSPQSRHLDEDEALHAVGITANAHGLIDSFADALRLGQALAVPDDGGPAALTGWLPWLLVRYPLAAP